ncbi:MAG: hypothetical protein JW971_04235, partial [Synergistales bacterium]|nr:hypothetical protein [Synergistales bacterium]
ETVSLGVLSGPYALYIDTIESPEPIRADQSIGKKVPIHASAIGKAILASQEDDQVETVIREIPFIRLTERTITGTSQLLKELEITRLQGYATDDEESLKGLQCFATPVMNFRSEPVAGLSVAFPKYRYKDEEDRKKQFLSMLNEASRLLSIQLGANLERVLS